ncbi:MAG: hypothetical protein NWF13_05450 [Candidatus Bathyarchaeota archaeon]|nr:hypothetical protein [Candidatus Bathyarchaeota archaeon]
MSLNVEVERIVFFDAGSRREHRRLKGWHDCSLKYSQRNHVHLVERGFPKRL